MQKIAVCEAERESGCLLEPEYYFTSFYTVQCAIGYFFLLLWQICTGLIYSKRVFLCFVCNQKQEDDDFAFCLVLSVCRLYRRTAQSLWHWIAPCSGTLCAFLSFTQWDWLKEQKWWPVPLYSFSDCPTHQRNSVRPPFLSG